MLMKYAQLVILVPHVWLLPDKLGVESFLSGRRAVSETTWFDKSEPLASGHHCCQSHHTASSTNSNDASFLAIGTEVGNTIPVKQPHKKKDIICIMGPFHTSHDESNTFSCVHICLNFHNIITTNLDSVSANYGVTIQTQTDTKKENESICTQ
jgi:hypothetical protein